MDNPPMRIAVNKLDNRLTFKIKWWYYHELLIPKTMIEIIMLMLRNLFKKFFAVFGEVNSWAMLWSQSYETSIFQLKIMKTCKNNITVR